MSEKGILFKKEMREAAARGDKTKTRRLSGLEEINKDPDSYQFKDWTHDGCASFVRRFRHSHEFEFVKLRYQVGNLLYVKKNYFTKKADAELWLEIVDVRIERLQDISLEDIEDEGVPLINTGPSGEKGVLAYEDFRILWDSINAKKGFGWDTNPWVAVYTFKRIDK